MHNNYVASRVPKENLLVWNIKDGWEPLCSFLGKPIPNDPIPHNNKTGDTKFIEKYAMEADIMKDAQKYLARAVIMDSIKIAIILYISWKAYRTDGQWIVDKIKTCKNILSLL